MEEAQAALKRARQENTKRERIEWDQWKQDHGSLRFQTPGPRFFDEKAFQQLSSHKAIPGIIISTGKLPRENDLLEERMSKTPGPGLYLPPSAVGVKNAVHISTAPVKRLNDLIEERARATPGVGDYDTTRLDRQNIGSGRISNAKIPTLTEAIYQTYKGTPGPLTYAPIVSGGGAAPSLSASKIKAQLLAGSRPSTAGGALPSLMPQPSARGRPVSAASFRRPQPLLTRQVSATGGFDRAAIEEMKGIGTGLSFATANMHALLFAAPSEKEEEEMASNGGGGGRGFSPTKDGSLVSSDGRQLDGSLAPDRLMSRLERAERELQAAAESVLADLPEEQRKAFAEKQARRAAALAASQSPSSSPRSTSTSPLRRSQSVRPGFSSPAEVAQAQAAMRSAEALVAAEEAAERGDAAAAEKAAREAEEAAAAAVAASQELAAAGNADGSGAGEVVGAAVVVEIARRARRASVIAREAADAASAAPAPAPAAAEEGEGKTAASSEAANAGPAAETVTAAASAPAAEAESAPAPAPEAAPAPAEAAPAEPAAA